MKKHTRRIPPQASNSTASASKKATTTPMPPSVVTSEQPPIEAQVLVESTEKITVLPLSKPGIENDSAGIPLEDAESVAVSFLSPFKHEIRHISVDCADTGWYSASGLVLRLKFHLILLDPSGAVEGLMLRTKAGDHPISFESLGSPMLSEANPDLSWSISARLAIDFKIQDVKLEIGENALLVKINKEWKDVVKICRAC